MQRTDPFFAPGKGRSSSYLESLHRTYGEPKSALPKRDDATFKRAMRFRMAEKEHYKTLQETNERLHSDFDRLQQDYSKLGAETAKMITLFEQLSKQNSNAEPEPKPDAGDASTSVPRDAPPKSEEHRSGGVPEQVLHPDPRGQSAEHGTEGSEPVDGVGSADESAGNGDGVRESSE